jgi:hypothetical protein
MFSFGEAINSLPLLDIGLFGLIFPSVSFGSLCLSRDCSIISQTLEPRVVLSITIILMSMGSALVIPHL